MDKQREYKAAADHEHALMNQRTSIFLLWHSILFGGYVLADSPLRYVIGVAALIASVMWLSVGLRSMAINAYYSDRLLEVEQSLPKDEQIWTKARQSRQALHGLSRIPMRRIMCIHMPGLWVATWAVALALALFHVR